MLPTGCAILGRQASSINVIVDIDAVCLPVDSDGEGCRW